MKIIFITIQLQARLWLVLCCCSHFVVELGWRVHIAFFIWNLRKGLSVLFLYTNCDIREVSQLSQTFMALRQTFAGPFCKSHLFTCGICIGSNFPVSMAPWKTLWVLIVTLKEASVEVNKIGMLCIFLCWPLRLIHTVHWLHLVICFWQSSWLKRMVCWLISSQF